MPFILHPLAEGFSAEVLGVQLGSMTEQSVVTEFRRAFANYTVLIVRDQQAIEYAGLRDFAAFFGQPSECGDITNLDADGHILDPELLDARYARGNALWHMDMLVLDKPPLAAMLLTRELPASGGGDTQFANLELAWNRYPSSKKRQLEKCVAVHSLETIRRKMGLTDPTEIKSEYPPGEHPLVCSDPLSNKRSLLFGAHTSHIKNMPPSESDALLDDLLAQATKSDGIYTHRWKPFDLLLWSNRRALHRVLPYEYRHERRRLWRMEILGDKRPANRKASFLRKFFPA